MADNNNAYEPQPINPENVPALKDEKAVPQQDGAIPQDSKGISDGNYDALQPIPNEQIKFAQGNYATITGLPKIVTDKVAQMQQMLLPLIEVALIELLGSNSMYDRKLGQCNPAFNQDGQLSIEFTFQYIVEGWISQDIAQESIQHDSNYVLTKLQPVKDAKLTKCEIDCNEGLLTIQGTI